MWFTAPRRVELRDEAVQRPGPDDVRVATIASGVSAGSELLVYRGDAPSELEPDLPTVAGSFALPIKFGYSSVGRVVETGAEVSRFSVGDLVFAHHPHQSGYVVPAAFLVALPQDVAPEVAVLTANLETALTVVLDARPRLGEAVFVAGQGVVGLLITMLLARAGAQPIITADGYPLRREAALRAGAHEALVPGETVPEQVRRSTAGRGADVAIEASGHPAALQSCLDAVAFGGTVVVASWYGSRRATLDLGGAFHRRRVRVLSSQVSTLDPALSARWSRERRAALVAAFLGQLPLADLITHRFALRDAARAYELLDRTPGEALQVVLTYPGAPLDA